TRDQPRIHGDARTRSAAPYIVRNAALRREPALWRDGTRGDARQLPRTAGGAFGRRIPIQGSGSGVGLAADTAPPFSSMSARNWANSSVESCGPGDASGWY